MRRTAGTRKSKVETYIEVRIETLREERNNTNNEETHLILDKGACQEQMAHCKT